MNKSHDPIQKYVLPTEFQENLDRRHFTYVSVYSPNSGELRNFVVWLPKPLDEVRARAESFILKLYGRALKFSLYPRTYVRDARGMAQLGMHEHAPIDVCRLVMSRYAEMWEAHQRQTDEKHRAGKARRAEEAANPTIVETGTYQGPIEGTGVCVWRDQLGYTHEAQEWMRALAIGQKFIDGAASKVPESVSVLTLVKGAKTNPCQSDISNKRRDSDLLDVAGILSTSPRSLILWWQGELPFTQPSRVHQHGDPLIEALMLTGDNAPCAVGCCAASLFESKVTKSTSLARIIREWGVNADELGNIRKWLKGRLTAASRPSPLRNWPLSRLAMPSWAELADLGDRRVTLYTTSMFGHRRIEATNLVVTRKPYAQYADAYSIRFKPRGDRHLRELNETYQPTLVALLGWGHPDLQQGFEQTEVNVQSSRYVSFDKRFEQEFDAALLFYLETHPLARIVLDLRGENVQPRHRSISDGDAKATKVPPELERSIIGLITNPASNLTNTETDERTRLFISYHHAGDAECRAQFEKNFHKQFSSSSVYPGEIEAKRGEPSIRRDIRTRVSECDCFIVVLGRTTYTRRWVDYEIRTSIDQRLRSGPRPLLGLLTPEVSSFVSDLRSNISTVHGKCRNQRGAQINVQSEADKLAARMLEACGFALPARFIDNLLTGYAVLSAWPKDEQGLIDLVRRARSASGSPINGRKLMTADGV